MSTSTRKFRSVLFVDDDPDICSVVRAALGLVPGLAVQLAESGEQAIEVAHVVQPDLVLMDVMMPGLDGPSTFERMRKSATLAHVPVIFMTAKVLPAEIAQFLRLGAIGVIVKPFEALNLYREMLGLWNGSTARAPAAPRGGGVPAQAQLDSLTAAFLRRASADVFRLANMIQRAGDGTLSALKEIERLAHSIHGAGAMFGFPKISEAGGAIARMVEGLAAAAGPQELAGDSPALRQLSESSKQLSREVEAAWRTTPQGTAMFQGPVTPK